MYCPKCGTNNTKRARFCAKCGAPLNGALGQRQTTPAQPVAFGAPSVPTQPIAPGRRPRRILPVVVGVVVAVLVAIGALVGFRMLGSSAADASMDDVEEMYSIKLTANRTDFILNEDGVVTLTVSLPPDDLASSVEVFSDDGSQLLSISSSDFSEDELGKSVAHKEFDVNTSTDGVTRIHAVSGDHQSSELAIFVTPRITEEQVTESIEVGSDLCDWLDKNYDGDEEDYEAIAKVAEEHLREDSRVGDVNRVGTSVYYNTTSLVAGAFEAEPHSDLEPDEMVSDGVSPNQSEAEGEGSKTSASIAALATNSLLFPDVRDITRLAANDAGDANVFGKSGRTFTENTDATRLFSSVSLGESTIDPETGPVHLSAGNTTTNGNAIALKMETAFGFTDLDGRISAADILDLGSSSSAVKRISQAADGNVSDVKKNDDAVRSIFSGSLSNYGTIIIYTHGGALKNEANEYCATAFSLYLAFLEPSEPAHLSYTGIEHALNVKASRYAQIYAEENPASSVSDFYILHYGKAGSEENWRIYTEYQRVKGGDNNKKIKYEGQILLTSTFMQEKYARTGFDNCVMYLACCQGVLYDGYIQWLKNNGCAAVIGYEKSISLGLVPLDIDDFANLVTTHNIPNHWRLNSFGEICRSNGKFRETYIDVFSKGWQLLLVEELWQEGINRNIKHFDNDNTNPVVIHDLDTFYSGTSSLSGKVYYKNEGEGDPEPCKGVTVKANLFLNQSFKEKGKTKTREDGSFKFSSLRSGLYVITIDDGKGHTQTVSIVVDEKNVEGGNIYLQSPTVYVHVKDTSGNVVDKATVTLTGDDGKVFKTTIVDRPEGKTFKALVTSQHYEVKVTPDDDHLTEATVELDVPDSEPWSHDVTVTLEDVCAISGLVADAQTNERLAGVEVGWADPSGDGFVQTGPDGSYRVEGLAPGEYTLTFKKVGYETEITTVSKNALVKAKNHEVAVPTIKLKPAAAGTAFSGCIGAYGGTTYSIEPVASTLTPLPTACARYDYICTFAFWGGKVYYCCKDAGTAQYHMALYEANLDGSGARELYAPAGTMSLSPRFAVSDGVLYYQEAVGAYGAGGYQTYAIDLSTGARREAGAPPDDVREFLDTYTIAYGDDKVHAGEPTNDYGGTDSICVTHADGSTETLASLDSNSMKLEAVVPIEGEGDAYVYYSASTDGYRTYNLFRKRLSGGKGEELGSRPSAGGGGYFAW